MIINVLVSIDNFVLIFSDLTLCTNNYITLFFKYNILF